MRIRLRGIKRVRKRLANGEIGTYFYAWRGGPRLEGSPGKPEFIVSYNAAVAGRSKPRTDRLESILDMFQNSDAFLSLAARTQSDYRKLLRSISTEFWDFPLATLTDKKTRGVFLEWRDRLAKKSRRQADYAWSVLARVFS